MAKLMPTDRDELSKFYKIGYRYACKTAILLVKKAGDDCDEYCKPILEKLVADILRKHNEYPLIEKMEMPGELE